MRRREDERGALAHDPTQLGDALLFDLGRNVLENFAEDNTVECPVGKGQSIGVRGEEAERWLAFDAAPQRWEIEVDSDPQPRPASEGDEPAAVVPAHVEHAVHRDGEMLVDPPRALVEHGVIAPRFGRHPEWPTRS